jgi:hypothetical protein
MSLCQGFFLYLFIPKVVLTSHTTYYHGRQFMIIQLTKKKTNRINLITQLFRQFFLPNEQNLELSYKTKTNYKPHAWLFSFRLELTSLLAAQIEELQLSIRRRPKIYWIEIILDSCVKYSISVYKNLAMFLFSKMAGITSSISIKKHIQHQHLLYLNMFRQIPL